MQNQRKRIVAANWKMNTTLQEGLSLLRALLAHPWAISTGCSCVLLPPFTHLFPLAEALKDGVYALGAQNCAHERAGAWTGEVSVRMLADLGVQYVLVGHSERRQHFGEDDGRVQQKIQRVQEENLVPMVCCGEPLAVRQAGTQVSFVERQILSALAVLDAKKPFVVAYEPIWAIGTGQTASADEAQSMHQSIRSLLQSQMGAAVAQRTSILYGGSVKADNITSLMAQSDIDGALVGGASLDAAAFVAIAKAVAC